MTLPTIQPVDWPDWGVMPTTSTAAFNVGAIALSGEIWLSAQVGYFSYAILNLSGDGDGSDWQAQIQWLTAAPLEGGSIVGTVDVVRMAGQAIVIPMAVWAPYLQIMDVDASAYPHNALGTLTLASQVPYQTGYPGGTRVIAEGQSVPGMSSATLIPQGCAPGEHCVQVDTAATVWSLYLVNFLDPGTAPDLLLADNTTVQPFDIRFIGPASSWRLRFDNGDVGAAATSIFVNRQP